MFYVLSGTAEFLCGGARLHAEAGDFVLLPRGEAHTSSSGRMNPCAPCS